MRCLMKMLHRNALRKVVRSQALCKTATPPSGGWANNASQAIEYGAIEAMLDVLRNIDDGVLFAAATRQTQAMCHAGNGADVVRRMSAANPTMNSVFAAFWSRAKTVRASMSDEQRESTSEAARAFATTLLVAAQQSPDAAVRAGTASALLALLPTA